MTGTPANHGEQRVRDAVSLRQQRQEQARERSLWQNLSMIGALGWLIVIPTLLGILAGGWLDERFETGILFSGALIFLGVVLGSYLAWQRISKEPDE